MNEYIIDCVEAWWDINKAFFQMVADVIVSAVKEAVEECKNE